MRKPLSLGPHTGAVVAVALLIGAPLFRTLQRQAAASRLDARISALSEQPQACPQIGDMGFVRHARRPLSSWQTIGGCGAGSSTSIGGIKWIGRNVRGGLVQVQCQGNYTRFDNGYSYSLQNQLTAELTDAWSVGAVVPYLYKYQYDPFGLGFDLSNQGMGDVNGLVTARFGAIRANSVTLSAGLPTGTHTADYRGNVLGQDRQLGSGEFSGALVLDHTFDELWGVGVLGGALSYPGKENDLQNYRSPSASLYGYAGYLLGAFVPAIGATAIAFRDADRDRGLASERAQFMGALNASLEWSGDWVAWLLGASVPFSRRGLEPWTVGIGFSMAPF